jgi:hypothetical protein
MLSWIGWVATAVFASSYLCKQPSTLRRVQAAAAVLWVVYGVLIHAAPVIVANLIVASVALASSLGSWGRPRAGGKLPRGELATPPSA